AHEPHGGALDRLPARRADEERGGHRAQTIVAAVPAPLLAGARDGARALRERDFRLYFAGSSLSLLGDRLVPVARAFPTRDLPGSAADLGWVLAAAWIPQIALVLFGGVLADRLSRRAVMLGADLVRAGSQAALAALLVSGRAELWQLLALQAVRGAASAFFNP